jgi:hypothetical protein
LAAEAAALPSPETAEQRRAREEADRLVEVARRAREDFARQTAARSTEALRLAETARRAEEEERKQTVDPKDVSGGAIFNEITQFIANKMPTPSRIGLEGGGDQTGGRVPVDNIRILLHRLRPNINASFDRDTVYTIHFPRSKTATEFTWVQSAPKIRYDGDKDINVTISQNTETGDFAKETHKIVGGAIVDYIFKFTIVKTKARFVSSGTPLSRAARDVLVPRVNPTLAPYGRATPRTVARAAENQRAEGMAASRPRRGGNRTRKNGRRMTRSKKDKK